MMIATSSSSPGTAAYQGAGDIFLLVETTKGGQVKGEASDQSHKDEIEVAGWSWAMRVPVDRASGQQSGKAAVDGLRILKRFDRASPVLMNCLLNGEEADARLVMRKSGKEPLEYLVIKLEHARFLSYEVQTGIEGGVSIPMESWTLGFGRIEVTYKAQRPDGLGGGEVMMMYEPWTGK